MKRLIMKFGFLMLLSISIFAMPIMASNGNGDDGCTSKCNRLVSVCTHYCVGDSDLTNTLCFILCELQAAFCLVACPITG